MKGSYSPGLGDVCGLFFGELSSGMKGRCLHLLRPARPSPGSGGVPLSVQPPFCLSSPYGRGSPVLCGQRHSWQRFAW